MTATAGRRRPDREPESGCLRLRRRGVAFRQTRRDDPLTVPYVTARVPTRVNPAGPTLPIDPSGVSVGRGHLWYGAEWLGDPLVGQPNPPHCRGNRMDQERSEGAAG